MKKQQKQAEDKLTVTVCKQVCLLISSTHQISQNPFSLLWEEAVVRALDVSHSGMETLAQLGASLGTLNPDSKPTLKMRTQ